MSILTGKNVIVQVGSETLPVTDFEIDCKPVCPHPEITQEIRCDSVDWTYYCTACRKKIIIPTSTMLTINEEKLRGIIGLAFGELWAERLTRWV